MNIWHRVNKIKKDFLCHNENLQVPFFRAILLNNDLIHRLLYSKRLHNQISLVILFTNFIKIALTISIIYQNNLTFKSYKDLIVQKTEKHDSKVQTTPLINRKTIKIISLNFKTSKLKQSYTHHSFLIKEQIHLNLQQRNKVNYQNL